MRAASLLLLVLVLAGLLPAAPALEPEEVFAIHAEWEGRFRVGLLAVGLGALDGEGAVPDLGVGPLNYRVLDVDVDDCRRDLRFRLEYDPRNVSADTPAAYVAVPNQMQVKLSDAATGAPLPGSTMTWSVPGTKAYALDRGMTVRIELFLLRGVDVAWSLRVSGWMPQDAECAWRGRLFVNEVEANPPGTDAGAEWIEVLNAGFADADLSNWTIRSTHGETNALVLPAGTILPWGERLVVTFPSQFIDNVDEEIVLTAPRGWEIDRTPKLSDGANDARTWQRSPDATDTWAFATGTQGLPNA